MYVDLIWQIILAQLDENIQFNRITDIEFRRCTDAILPASNSNNDNALDTAFPKLNSIELNPHGSPTSHIYNHQISCILPFLLPIKIQNLAIKYPKDLSQASALITSSKSCLKSLCLEHFDVDLGQQNHILLFETISQCNALTSLSLNIPSEHINTFIKNTLPQLTELNTLYIRVASLQQLLKLLEGIQGKNIKNLSINLDVETTDENNSSEFFKNTIAPLITRMPALENLILYAYGKNNRTLRMNPLHIDCAFANKVIQGCRKLSSFILPWNIEIEDWEIDDINNLAKAIQQSPTMTNLNRHNRREPLPTAIAQALSTNIQNQQSYLALLLANKRNFKAQSQNSTFALDSKDCRPPPEVINYMFENFFAFQTNPSSTTPLLFAM